MAEASSIAVLLAQLIFIHRSCFEDVMALHTVDVEQRITQLIVFSGGSIWSTILNKVPSANGYCEAENI